RRRSRRPSESNRHSSTFDAWAENTAKFTPEPSNVAPSGQGLPASSEGTRKTLLVIASLLQPDCGREHEGCERRQHEADAARLAMRTRVGRLYRPPIAHAGTAVDVGIRIEDLVPGARQRHADAVVMTRHRGHVADHQHAFALVSAQERKHAVFDVIADHPRKTLGARIGSMQRSVAPVHVIEVANDCLHPRVRWGS